ncbi:MAG: SET domain-containing protein-lysine N-methyltransferase [Parcubacteria group bacterium]
MRKKMKFSVKRSKSGLGLFAMVDFAKEDFVIEYTGEKLPNSIADNKNSKYIFALNSRSSIDGSARKNIARYINHSCWPNCEAETRGQRILIRAKRKIKAGEELSYDYGKEYFDEYIKPNGCRCERCQEKRK